MKTVPLLFPILVVFFTSWTCGAAGSSGKPTRAPFSIELPDQYNAPHKLSFPSTNVTVLTLADRKGSEQVDGWIAALTPRYAGQVSFCGIADVAGAPRFVRGRIRKKFQESRQYPVMMDWSGKVCPQFGLQPDVANVLIIARDGDIRARAAGPASDPALDELVAAIDAALVRSASVQTNTAPAQSTWPQWRGLTRDGLVSGAEWPKQLDASHLRQVWRVELGPSYSGPIVAGDRVFTTETKDQKFEVVTALNRKTGKELWRAQWEGSMAVPFFAKSNGDWIRSTPAWDDDRLYVAGMRDVLVCLNATTGEEEWRKDFVKELGTALPDFGFVCSPLVDADAVYVQAGGSLAKLDKRSGTILWQAMQDKGGMMGSAFSSPIFAELAGKRQLVVQTRDRLAGVDPADGKVLWEQPTQAFRGMNILTPVTDNDMLFTSTYGGRTIGFKVVQANGNFTVTEMWRHKSQGYMTTPVVINGVAYTHLKSQRVMAIEIDTGRELWTSDRSFGKYMSLVAQGNRILALDQRGDLFLLGANEEKFELIDESRITDAETWAHLAIAGNELFVRELNALTAFRWSREPASSTTRTRP